MNRHRHVRLIVSITILNLTLIAAQTGRSESSAPDAAAIGAAVDDFHQALAAGDRNRAMSFLSPDAVVLESGDKQTRAEYEREHLAEDIAFARTTTTTHSPLKIQQEGNIAWTIATSRTTGTFNGREVNSAGVELMVLTKTGDGWQIRAVHWSSRKVADDK